MPDQIDALFGVDGTTCRGFGLVTFRDEYYKACSLQISSRAVCENDDGTVDDPLGWIWLGIDDAEPQIMKTKARELGMSLPPGEVSGWMPYPVPDDVLMHTRMHLNEEQVRGLMARLQSWLDTGEFNTPNAQIRGGTPPVESDGWLPIDTAPKDGTRVLAHETGVVDRAYWDCDRPGWYTYGMLWYPTDWMPLPACPHKMEEDDV